MIKQKYVLGFAFDTSLNKVLLIEKDRPEFMKGRLNGLGGSLHTGEIPEIGMIREFREESGIITSFWTHFATFFCDAENYEVFCFYEITDKIFDFQQMESEKLDVYDIDKLNFQTRMPKVDWLISMAINHIMRTDKKRFFNIEEL